MARVASVRERLPAHAANSRLVGRSSDSIEQLVEAAGRYLGLDVGFVSESVGDGRIFQRVSVNEARCPVRQSSSTSSDDGYCRRVMAAELSALTFDTSQVPAFQELPARRQMTKGAPLTVPVLLSDGRLYGTLCCFSFGPDPCLNERALQMLRLLAGLVALQIGTEMDHVPERTAKVERITAALAAGEPTILYQPVVRLADGTIQGAEALARFAGIPARPPDRWFAEADEIGLKTRLELQAIDNALAGFAQAWCKGPFSLKLNVSPQTVLHGDLPATFAGYPANRLVLEITEHEQVDDYDCLIRALAPLRTQGVRIAIDDVGAGYACMRHVLGLKPDVIKLDISLTRDIDRDPRRRALTGALVSFGNKTDCYVVAEGIETAAELSALRRLGVHAGQGYYLGRPQSLDDFLTLP